MQRNDNFSFKPPYFSQGKGLKVDVTVKYENRCTTLIRNSSRWSGKESDRLSPHLTGLQRSAARRGHLGDN
jgi:5-enolpyruvylshikimate-3-phosphate synthase